MPPSPAPPGSGCPQLPCSCSVRSHRQRSLTSTRINSASRRTAIFTNNPGSLIEAESQHRGHAIVEQVIADLKSGPLAHLPSKSFQANAAWLAAATIAFNLTRAIGVAAGGKFTKAEGATVRARIINTPARVSRSGRRQRLHLPRRWPWASHWQTLWTSVMTT